MMHSEEFDILIITHLPAFYKIGLYNKIAEKKRIYVMFIGSGSTIRVQDFTLGKIDFKYEFLNDGPFEDRRMVSSCIKMLTKIVLGKFKGVIVNGWELPEFWIASFFSGARKGLALESTDLESNVKGLKKILKKIFISQLDFALPSGIPHKRLLQALRFKGDIRITGGVGFTTERKLHLSHDPVTIYKALYIGRLSFEKNLPFLIKVINEMKEIELSIIGSGPQMDLLQQIAGTNIHFYGPIANKELNEIFANHHFFILPSISETWGLVIEEALQSNKPVIVSDAVGCSEDLVKNLNTGIVFKAGSEDELRSSIEVMRVPENYMQFVENTKKIDWQSRRGAQVSAYANLGNFQNEILSSQ